MMGYLGDFLRVRQPQVRTMDLLDEALIERYVRFKSTLSDEDLERAEDLVRTSSAARRLAEFFREYYEELDATEANIKNPWGPAQEGEA